MRASGRSAGRAGAEAGAARRWSCSAMSASTRSASSTRSKYTCPISRNACLGASAAAPGVSVIITGLSAACAVSPIIFVRAAKEGIEVRITRP